MGKCSKALLLAGSALCFAACHKQEQGEQNIIVDNGVMANAEIEALPTDESSEMQSEELANGDDGTDLNASANAY